MEPARSVRGPTSSSRRRAGPLPAFYQPSNSATSAAKIIAEVKQSLRVPATQRPYTPADSHRMLFGKRRTDTRPPSAYSIGSRHFADSRPPTGQKLEPIEHTLLAQRLSEVNPTPPTPVQSTCSLHSHSSSADIVTPSLKTSEPRRKKTEPPPFWQAEIAPLLSRLSPSSPPDPAGVREAVDDLHHCLQERQCYGRLGGVAGVKQRSAVLRMVFSLLDSSDPSLLMKLAKIIIAMEVTGKNLLNVCKLLFSLARTETNDHFFSLEAVTGPLVGLLGRCDAVSDANVLVYGVGTLKLLASNNDLRLQLVECDALSFLASLLDHYNHSSLDTALTADTQNVLVQLTAALRNLSEYLPLHASFLSSGLVTKLAATLSSHLSHPDITFNIARLLSKLTLHRDCCKAVLDCPTFLPLLLQSLTTHHTHPDILVRVCFILGNLTTEDDNVRCNLCVTHNALSPLTSLTSSCVATELTKVKEGECEAAHEKSSNEDLLIKLVRLLANLSVNAQVGSQVASDKAIVDKLMNILCSLPLASYCELMVNTLATLNNLSFHAPHDSYLIHSQQELSRLLVQVLLEDDGEPLLECVRCYGNLSRHKSFQQTVAKTKVDQLLVTLLDSSRHELVSASCGVLVNLMTDPLHRSTLTSSGGVAKLVDVLRDFGSGDWQLASLVCQTLWNFSMGMTSSVSCFGESEVESLIELLHSYCEVPETSEQEWRDHFLPVGTSLLDRVRTHHTDLVPLSDTD